MKVISTNIGKSSAINWNGEILKTGIYKYPTNKAILLQKEDVKGDAVIDRKHHGGLDKACYLFSADNYDFWKEKYPDLDWDWGMFGENITIKGLDESKIRIGNSYKLGKALVQATQPREPCFKLGIRFKDQNILGQFVANEKPGVYLRVLEEGTVTTGDSMELVTESKNTLTVRQSFQLLYMRKKDNELMKLAFSNEVLPLNIRERLERFK